jgi:hypothetical protein
MYYTSFALQDVLFTSEEKLQVIDGIMFYFIKRLLNSLPDISLDEVKCFAKILYRELYIEAGIFGYISEQVKTPNMAYRNVNEHRICLECLELIRTSHCTHWALSITLFLEAQCQSSSPTHRSQLLFCQRARVWVFPELGTRVLLPGKF